MNESTILTGGRDRATSLRLYQWLVVAVLALFAAVAWRPVSAGSLPAEAPASSESALQSTRPDPNGTPTYGTVYLSAGFLPDPRVVQMTSGGSLNAATAGIGSNCRGYVTRNPDLRLYWSGSTTMLRILFTATTAGRDTTLVVNDPNGRWYCNDDYSGVNPGLQFNNPTAGRYEIWIGSYVSGQLNAGRLSITERTTTTTNTTTPNGLDHQLPPAYGSATLAAGFLPDPRTAQVRGGGTINVATLGYGSRCVGNAMRAPDYTLNWSGSTSQLRILFRANLASQDATLIVRAPNGVWHCNDDIQGLNPGLILGYPIGGQYDIWVGSLSSGSYIDGRLIITEYNSLPGDF